MDDDFKKIIYSVLTGFAVLMVVWLVFLFLSSCGLDFSCEKAVHLPAGTPIPTLIPATMPAPTRFVSAPTATAAPTQPVSAGPDIARPSNPGGPGDAVNLTGDASEGEQVYATNCVTCHGEKGVGGVANPGSTDGTVPELNPIDPTLIDPDYKTYAYNLDLFIEHGSTPEGTSPVFKMPAWGDSATLTQQQIADAIAYLISLNPAPVVAATPAPPASDVARPSNPGGPGDAVNLTGDATAGAQLYATNCVTCHGEKGVGGVANPGSTDGTVPELNPIDPTIKAPDYKTFAFNLDLFIEHGSTPEGPSPVFKMPAWGDLGVLTPQQIADIIAYLISLNP
jgi:mono/diheme cytochrome c family protein